VKLPPELEKLTDAEVRDMVDKMMRHRDGARIVCTLDSFISVQGLPKVAEMLKMGGDAGEAARAMLSCLSFTVHLLHFAQEMVPWLPDVLAHKAVAMVKESIEHARSGKPSTLETALEELENLERGGKPKDKPS
jgi:hypothetical protein